MMDEVVSGVQKLIRQCDPRAVVFAARIIRSGYINYLFSRHLAVIMCEDVGPAFMNGMVELLNVYDLWHGTVGKSKSSKVGEVSLHARTLAPALYTTHTPNRFCLCSPIAASLCSPIVASL